ncbi:nuclear transport factor 2 family protein [Devosia sp.]|uniref:nuclear transport factor 2 family protein n=1 Tax=Devosia sp. TaxID=1871048 RepID=UPI001B1D710B|nr:nuclear transport factor 2 family protein [Devosia sp.]MBO9590750.1 nuclear transport factor 2 family protein [Devosia sp.]
MTVSPTLPAPLPEYFGRTDDTKLLDLFAPDATIKDEGKVHQGAAEISEWLESVEARYHPRYRVIAAEQDGERATVTFVVSGTFPGSPATLRQNFVLTGNRIQRIETL